MAQEITVRESYVAWRAAAELAGKEEPQFKNPNTAWAKAARKLVDAKKAELTSGKSSTRKSAGRISKAASQINTSKAPRVAVREESECVTVVMPRSVAVKYGFVK